MKEAIGTSLVFNLMLIFVGVMIAILIGSISYSKGFKIRNRIIDRIEEYAGYDVNDNNGVVAAIENDLKSIGYKIVKQNNCEKRNGVASLNENIMNNYNYCVYEYTTSKGKYYGVTVFINFDIPLIGDYINIPVYGETRVIFEKEKVEG